LEEVENEDAQELEAGDVGCTGSGGRPGGMYFGASSYGEKGDKARDVSGPERRYG
jgi:hypothetical protein